MKPSTVAGSGPNTRNPAGGADGVWVGSVGGSLPKLAIGQRRSGGVLAQLAINHLVARRSGEVQAVFPFSERSEHAPPVRGTGTPEGDLFGCVRPKEEVDPPVAPTRTREALASWLIRGLSLGCYSAPRRRVSISMTMKPVATIAAFRFSVGAKSAAASRNSRKVVMLLSDRRVCGGPSP